MQSLRTQKNLCNTDFATAIQKSISVNRHSIRDVTLSTNSLTKCPAKNRNTSILSCTYKLTITVHFFLNRRGSSAYCEGNNRKKEITSTGGRKGFLGLSLFDKVKSTDIHQSLNIEPQLLCIE